jgi:hypothetical protein
MHRLRVARPHGAWLVAIWFFVNPALAHSFYDRYDLPIPLSYFLWGAALVVALTFVCMVFLAPPVDSKSEPHSSSNAETLSRLSVVTRTISLLLFLLTIAAALYGTGNPLMNLAPSLVWITWWVGLSLVIAFTGNVWPWLDPWRTLFDMLVALGLKPLNCAWPSRLGMCPAVLALLAWSWLEVVNPIAVVPRDLGVLAIAWTAISLLGMFIYGPETWQSRADFVAIYFALIAKIGLQDTQKPVGYVGFILAMLSTVLFDGLHGHPAWIFLEEHLLRFVPNWLGNQTYFAGTLGLVVVWLIFMLSYKLTTRAYAKDFASSLIPIAVAYLLAHNFSNLVIQGQNVIFLLSDPFGWGWNLFGTANFKPNSEMINAKLTWYLAVSSIVVGHVLAVWLAHRTARCMTHHARQAARLTLPLTALMIAYTVLSLLIIAEPLVQA